MEEYDILLIINKLIDRYYKKYQIYVNKFKVINLAFYHEVINNNMIIIKYFLFYKKREFILIELQIQSIIITILINLQQ